MTFQRKLNGLSLLPCYWSNGRAPKAKSYHTVLVHLEYTVQVVITVPLLETAQAKILYHIQKQVARHQSEKMPHEYGMLMEDSYLTCALAVPQAPKAFSLQYPAS